MAEVSASLLRDVYANEKACRDLAAFCRKMWPVLEATPLIWNWHHELICEEVQALMLRRPLPHPLTGKPQEFRSLVICEPPRFLKSRLANVFAPLWLWLQRPWFRFQTISHSDTLGTEHSFESRLVLQSEEYRELVVHMAATRPDGVGWAIEPSQRSKVNFRNTQGGRRQTLTVGGSIIGKGANGQIVDDPYDVKQALLGNAEQVRRRMKDIEVLWDNAWRSRLDDVTASWRLLIMQRVHPLDLAGTLIARGVRALVLPQEYDPDFPLELGGVHRKDPRTEKGELLHPIRFPRSEVEDIRKTSTGRQFLSTQHNQRPVDAKGSLLKRVHVKRHDASLIQAEGRALDWAITVDANFKASGGSRCAVQLWARRGEAKFYLQRAIAGHWDYPELRRRVMSLWRAHQGRITMVLIEDKANGPALIADLRNLIPCIIAYSPRDSKMARAQRMAPTWEAGSISVAEDAEGDLFVDEVCAFPEGGYDDHVDAMGQLLQRWEQSMPEVSPFSLGGGEQVW